MDRSRMLSCLACGLDLKDKVKDRRVLVTSKDVLPLWKDLLLQKLSQFDPNTELLSTQLDVLLGTPNDAGHGLICKKCFTTYTRCNKDLLILGENMEKAINSGLFTVLRSQSESPSLSSSSSSSVAPPAKRGEKRTMEHAYPPAKRFRESTMVSSSPPAMVTIGYKKPKSYILTPSRKRIGKSLARGSRCAFVRESLKDEIVCKYIVRKVASMVNREIVQLCSDKVNSSLLNPSFDSLATFSWDTLYAELGSQCPILTQILKRGSQTRQPRSKQIPIICLCIALICNNRRKSMSLVQQIISVLLYNGRSSKHVYTQLNKISLCTSHTRLLKLVDEMGKDFDKPVTVWRKSIEQMMEKSGNTEDQACTQPTVETITSLPSYPENDLDSSVECDVNEESFLSSLPEMREDSSTSNGSEPSTPKSVASPAFTLVISSPSVLHSEDESEDQLEGVMEEGTQECGAVKKASQGTSGGTDNAMLSTAEGSDETQLRAATGEGEMDSSARTDTSEAIAGTKIIIDNVDKNVRPGYMTSEKQTKSLHYVQMYAVKDRTDISQLSDDTPVKTPSLTTDDIFKTILPSPEDNEAMAQYFSTLVSRVLVTHVPFFTFTFADTVQWNIPHQFSKEMSKKSQVTPLGVLPKDENKLEDMVCILDHIHQYIPMLEQEQRVQVTPSSDEDVLRDHRFHRVLLGGDQLTVARARSCQRGRGNSDSGMSKLSGVIPIAEDWHTAVILLTVMWKRLYSSYSVCEKGTLYQLKNVINRTNLKANPKDDVNATHDFITLITTCHILSAAMQLMNMRELKDTPEDELVDESTWMLPISERKEILTQISRKIVDTYINFKFDFVSPAEPSLDGVYAYAIETLSLGLFYESFKDAIKEGNGEHVLRCWKYFIPIFKASGRTNYSIEAFVTLFQYHYTLSPRQSHQLKWSRFINTHGLPGHNIECDLHMEHLNRLCKTAVRDMGANKTQKAILRASKALGKTSAIVHNFDNITSIKAPSQKHSSTSISRDRDLILQVLNSNGTFTETKGRKHRSFPNLKSSIMTKIKENDLRSWIEDQVLSYM